MQPSYYYTKPGQPVIWSLPVLGQALTLKKSAPPPPAEYNQARTQQMTPIDASETEVRYFVRNLKKNGYKVSERGFNDTTIASVEVNGGYRKITKTAEGFKFGCGLKKRFNAWRQSKAAVDILGPRS